MFLFFLFFVLFTAGLATAAPTPRGTGQWFTVEWDAPEFTAMSGDFVIPNLPENGGIPSVWPGLQGDIGVLQAELNGQSGAWTLGTSFYGLAEPSLGSRFPVSPGDMVHFSFMRNATSGLWVCTLTGTHNTEQTVSLPAENLNRAIFAVDVTDVPHDFTVSYSNVVITAASTAIDWCGTTASNGYGAGAEGYTVTNATAEGTTCRIGQIILPGTA
ncbi:hypothetical protein JB92DRAFT_238092 [Gautieria morchelliformis]|nr:hypothetical protein JB92DRAFT_238092 [Gautieria morchelliformis]